MTVVAEAAADPVGRVEHLVKGQDAGLTGAGHIRVDDRHADGKGDAAAAGLLTPSLMQSIPSREASSAPWSSPSSPSKMRIRCVSPVKLSAWLAHMGGTAGGAYMKRAVFFFQRKRDASRLRNGLGRLRSVPCGHTRNRCAGGLRNSVVDGAAGDRDDAGKNVRPLPAGAEFRHIRRQQLIAGRWPARKTALESAQPPEKDPMKQALNIPRPSPKIA